MKLTSENCTRKIDGLGRVSLPKGMRDRMGFIEGHEVEFYSLEDGDSQYLCIKSPLLKNIDEEEELAAIALLESMGYTVTSETEK